MRPHHQRQVARRHAFRQREEGRDHQPVGRGIADRVHGHQRLAWQRGALPVLQVQRAAAAVEQPHLAGLGVAPGADQPQRLGRIGGDRLRHQAGQALAQPAPVGRQRGVVEIAARAVVRIGRPQQAVIAVRQAHCVHVDAAFGVRVHRLQAARLHIQQGEPGEVAALVGEQPRAAVVRVESAQQLAVRQRLAGMDGVHTGRVDADDVRAAVIAALHAGAQAVLGVEGIAGDAGGVAEHLGAHAGGDVHQVQVEPLRVAFVGRHVHAARRAARQMRDGRPHALAAGQQARRRQAVGAGRLVHVDRAQRELLVAGLVTQGQQRAAVERPAPRVDRLRRIGDAACVFPRLAQRAHPQRHSALVRELEREEAAIGREVGVADAAVGEEERAVGHVGRRGRRRDRDHGRRRRRGAARRQREHAAGDEAGAHAAQEVKVELDRGCHVEFPCALVVCVV